MHDSSNGSKTPPAPGRKRRLSLFLRSARSAATPDSAASQEPESTQLQADSWRELNDELLDLERIVTAGGALPRRLAWEWGLVLEARGLAFRLEHDPQGYRLLTPAADADRALHEIKIYEIENRDAAPPLLPPPMYENSAFTVGVMLLLGLFHGISQNQWRLFGHDASKHPLPWVASGACDCFEIMYHGAWWRSVTALTLHADAAHVASNMGIGLLVMLPLCRELGSGAGWLLPLLAGALGNLLNCQVQGTGHLSVGASTAVFGAVGVLSAVRATRQGRFTPRELLLPLGAGVGLLALLGMSNDPQTDVSAHLCGFAAGLVLGAAAGLAVRRHGPPASRLSQILGALALALVVGSWALALN